MQHLIVEVGILHVLQSGLSPESTPLSANGGILGKDARVPYSPHLFSPPITIHHSNVCIPNGIHEQCQEVIFWLVGADPSLSE